MLVQPADLTGGSHLGLTYNADEPPHLNHNHTPFSTNPSDDDATAPDSGGSDLEASFAWHDEETRLRYARLAARARAQELAYAQKLARKSEMEHERARDRRRDQSRSRSRSRSNTRNPVFTGLFHHRRERHASHGSTTMSRPGTPNNEKWYATFLCNLFFWSCFRIQLTSPHSITRSPLLKFIPIPRSGSSKSVHSSVSSQPASSRPSSPFSSPRTPLSPLPFFLTPRKRRASAVPGPGDDSAPQGLSEGSKGIGVPLARVARRPSPVRATTPPPISEDMLQSQTAKPRNRITQYPAPSVRARRPSAPATRGEDAEDTLHAPHLLFDGGIPLTRVERRRLPPRSQTIGT